jgi:hypothetical protein
VTYPINLAGRISNSPKVARLERSPLRPLSPAGFVPINNIIPNQNGNNFGIASILNSTPPPVLDSYDPPMDFADMAEVPDWMPLVLIPLMKFHLKY